MNLFHALNSGDVGDIFQWQWDEESVAAALSVNTKNRGLKHVHIGKLMSDMNGGRWVEGNGDTIRFARNTNGHWVLANGQHTLTSMKKTGMFFSIPIAIVPEHAFVGAIDCGAPRSDRDNCKITGLDIGVQNYITDIPSTAAGIWGGASGQNNLSRSANLVLIGAAQDAIRFVHNRAMPCKKRGINTRSTRAVVGRAFYNHNVYKAIMGHDEYLRRVCEFGNMLITGEGKGITIKLRNWLLDRKVKSGGSASVKKLYLKTLWAFDHFIRDNNPKTLRVAQNDIFVLPNHISQTVLSAPTMVTEVVV